MKKVLGTFAILSALVLAQWKTQPAGTQIPLDTFPMSAALSPDGRFLLVLNAGAHQPSISVLRTEDMKETARVPVADAWLGLTFSPDGQHVYAGGGSRNSVYEFEFSRDGAMKQTREILVGAGAPGPQDFIGDVAVSPDGRTILAADLFHDRVIAIQTQSGRVAGRYKSGRRPYRILFYPDGKSYFVSSWAEGVITEHDPASGYEMGRIRVGARATDMILSDHAIPGEDNPWKARLFVTAPNTNDVFVVGVGQSKELTNLGNFGVEFSARQPAGMTPSALALSLDQTELLVACSDANAVAVADISESRTRIAGFIPVGSYPTAVKTLARDRLAIVNGGGSLSEVDPLTDDSLERYTKTAMDQSAYRDAILEGLPAQQSSIEHVVYILVDGHTDGANKRKIEREFVKFDGYRAMGETFTEGEYWALAGIVPNFTRKLAINVAAGRGHFGGFEGGEFANLPPAGYLWSNAVTAGLTVRNYGEFVENRPSAGPEGAQVSKVNDPSLQGITNMRFRGIDAAYKDNDRARVVVDDLKQFESSGMMPNLMIVHLGGDSDAAIGAIADAVSKSRFWPKTAIFTMETSGKDASILALSPYAKRGTVDHTNYDQTSVLRTVELMLGLRPMTMFDAAAHPLGAAFIATPNNAAYAMELGR